MLKFINLKLMTNFQKKNRIHVKKYPVRMHHTTYTDTTELEASESLKKYHITINLFGSAHVKQQDL